MRVCFLGFTIVAVGLFSACTLTEPPSLGGLCPPDGIGELAYVQDADGYALRKDSGSFSDAFYYRRCPKNYRCSYDNSEGQYYCVMNCPSGQIMCDGRCVDPSTDARYCGASGACSVNIPGSSDYKGMVCGDNAECDTGMCKCKQNYQNCGSDDSFACVDTRINQNHCGDCNNQCSDGTCQDGHCVKEHCGDKICNLDECENTDEKCGKNCIDCTQSSKICDVVAGECKSCNSGDIWSQKYQTCVPEGIENCKASGQETGVNCFDGREDSSGRRLWDTIRCEGGLCKVTCNNVVDSEGFYYHINGTGDYCEKDTINNCGDTHVDCETLDGSGKYFIDPLAKTVDCDKGKCVATSCIDAEYARPFGYLQSTGEIEFVADDTGFYPLFSEIFGWFFHVYHPKNGVCTEINKKTFCGKNHLDCSSVGQECVYSLPEKRCIDHVAMTGCEETDMAQNDREYCVLNYSCQCPVGKHPSADQLGCDSDTVAKCGGEDEAHNCNHKCDLDEHCDSAVICDKGRCSFYCDTGYEMCMSKQKCVLSGDVNMSLCGEEMGGTTLDCGNTPQD